jgi:ribonuclease HI
MQDDPRALRLYIDGNCYGNPGGAGGYACVAKYPDEWNREDEVLFDDSFHETTNNRMELLACIQAFDYIAEQGTSLNVQRVLIVTDSLYENWRRAPVWRRNGWKNVEGRPIENSDLWKKFLSTRLRTRLRVDLMWRKGKKSPALKMVDRAAKSAGKTPQNKDWCFRGGKVASSKVKQGSGTLYPAKGDEAVIRVYRTGLIRKTGHKVTFDLWDATAGTFTSKHVAYTEAELIDQLHRQHSYRVRFNSNPKHPVIEEILEEVVRPPSP